MPKLIANQDYALVDVRRGTYGQLFEHMEHHYRGPCSAGDEWEGYEGERMCVRYTSYENQEPPPMNYCASGFLGVNQGGYEITRF